MGVRWRNCASVERMSIALHRWVTCAGQAGYGRTLVSAEKAINKFMTTWLPPSSRSLQNDNNVVDDVVCRVAEV